MKILIIFLASHLLISEANNCFQSNKSEAHFFCPIDYKELGGFEVLITPMQEVIIQCQDLKSLEISQLPNITISKITRLQFRSCPLPQTGFKTIKNSFSKKSLTAIEYESGNPDNQTLTKEMFQDMNNLKFLKLDRNNFKNLDESVFTKIPNLVALVLKQNYLSVIKEKLFEKLEVLEWLDLSGNQLKNLPVGLFKSLKKLKHLSLQSNQIGKLSNSVFEGLSNLHSLDLSGNRIKTISEKTFGQMKTLVNLSLAMNDLRSIPVNVFANNSNLEVVILKDNVNFQVRDNLFSKFSVLQEVDLSNCNLKEIPSNIFAYSHRLRAIHLQRNALKTLSEKIFENLINLEKIDLSGNELNNIDDTFVSLKKLRMLSLEGNAIKTINEGTFANLILLEDLNLAQNQITYIHGNAFSNNYRLRVINLSRNGYRGGDNIFKNLVYLQNVYLSHNLITDVEEIITLNNKPLMETLDLRKNSISRIYLLTLQGLSDLDINLEFNNISFVSFEDVDFSRSYYTVTIHLEHNPIRCDCHNYDLLKYFKGETNQQLMMMFNIRGESLKCADLEFVKNNSIDNMQLSSVVCALEDFGCPEECVCSWRPFDSSVIVDCANRNLTYLPKITTSSFQWENFTEVEVNLANNSLISVNLSQCVNVTSLFLSHNKLLNIYGVPDQQLKVLKVDHNHLTTLDHQLLQYLKTSSLGTLILRNNPWVCNCDSENLRIFVRNHLNKVDFRSVYCYNSTVRLIDLQEGQLCREVEIIYTSFVICLSLVVSVSSVFAFLFIICSRVDAVPLVVNYMRSKFLSRFV